jgi:formylglycine-generating enzyme required for sulfatase activity
MMGERHALLIGTDKFEDPELSTLLAPVADIEALSAVLRDPDICDFASAPVLLNPGIVELQKALRTLFNDRASDDLLLLYYTGHGLRDPESGTLYLALHETMKAEPSIGSLEADYVRKRMKASLAGTQIIVLDCCHSGAFMADAAKGAKGQPSYVEVRDAFDTGGSGHYIMSACSKSEAAFEDRREKPQSIFTKYLVDGLRTGDAAPDQDAITIDALYKYTRKQVIDRKWPMDPQRWITSGSGDPVIARNPNIRRDVPKELRDMLLTGDKYQQLGAVQQLQALAELDNASYTADRALEVLREGLKASDWVSVQAAIRAVLGVAQEIAPPIEVAPPKKPETRVADPTPEPSPVSVINTPDLHKSWFGYWLQSTKGSAFRAAFFLAIIVPIAVVYSKLRWEQWFPFKAVIVTDKQAIPESGSFQDRLPDGTLGPEMVVVQPGKFLMGSLDGVGEPDEHPQHEVIIAKAFAVGKYEVTFDEWQACAKDGGCQANSEPNDFGFGKGRHPVIGVSWDDTQEYIDWIKNKTRKSYRLLSEAEWEYAARAGNTTTYSTGETITTAQAQIDGSGKTAEVGSFPANPFGLNDMYGNVWEWVQDCNVSYDYATTDGSARPDIILCMRVMRGGGWDSTLQVLRAAYRNDDSPARRARSLGFRLAMTL